MNPRKAISKILGAFDNKIIEKEIEKVVDKFRLKGRVIDYGCGQMTYNHLFKNSEIIGADIKNPTMPTKATIVIRNYKTRTPKNSFDVGICAEVIEHAEEPDKVLKELNRIIRPGGYLILTTPFMVPEHDERDYWRFTLKGLKILAKKHGFAVVHEKKLTKNLHTAGHMTGNAMLVSMISKRGKIKYITGPIVFPFYMIVRGIFSIFNKMSSVDTGPMICMIVCKKK